MEDFKSYNEAKDDIKKGDTVRIKKQHTNSAAEAKRDIYCKRTKRNSSSHCPKRMERRWSYSNRILENEYDSKSWNE